MLLSVLGARFSQRWSVRSLDVALFPLNDDRHEICSHETPPFLLHWTSLQLHALLKDSLNGPFYAFIDVRIRVRHVVVVLYRKKETPLDFKRAFASRWQPRAMRAG
jgi:hypothetical protein